MSDYMPEEVILKILNRLPVKSLLRFRSVCKSWNTLISHPSFISAHLQASLSNNNTPFLLLKYRKNGKYGYFLHYDIDGFEEFKQLQFSPFRHAAVYSVVGSCNGLICVLLYDMNFVLWNPSIQKYISFPKPSITYVSSYKFGFGFGFDSRTNDYKVLVVGTEDDESCFELFSLNGNCWKRVDAVYPKYAFAGHRSLPFVNGAVHWLGYRERNNDEYSHAILGFDFSVEDFFEMNFPESFSGWGPYNLSIEKYGESSIAVIARPADGELHELWVMKEYGVVESWTKMLTLLLGKPGYFPHERSLNLS
ncbi:CONSTITUTIVE EXPRESSER OF PR GENES 1, CONSTITUTIVE EXPRESSER OF PR GENES 30 [Hibiscus trionum]|uniref:CONSTITUTIVE EXPRESSER OF PR GENES 1, CONSTITUTIVE EXPRESSER OF PR GENES 30 n=1 Tax=Hibiscus trionum TaxID=183268 RepID=A0A9W7HKI2_HIBTR|nr:CONSTITUTIVE EXPRESSER OF PR GENES 1, CONSTITUTIVE EXPRESSER OF PR GENES 30 [Hibiscus trionum]